MWLLNLMIVPGTTHGLQEFTLIGLSKNERPILDHQAKAHNFETRRISCEIRRIS